jgi:hypothetical protein
VAGAALASGASVAEAEAIDQLALVEAKGGPDGGNDPEPARPGPVGTLPVRAEVTDYLLPAVAAGDEAMLHQLVDRCLDGLASHDWQPDGIEARYAVV